MTKTIKNGQPWLDTEGKRIHAHGGSVMYWDGCYYWYGENKEKTTGENKIWHWGVRCYRSADLYNWEDLGLIIPPDLTGAVPALHPESKMDRPHIIYNEKTKKFVCWLKIIGENGGMQSETVLVSDSLLGPYTAVKPRFHPLGMDAGDFDLVVDPQTKKAYYYFERVHEDLICAELTDDYTDVSGVYTTHFPHPEGTPFVREAPAHFERGGKHYLITSGTLGYLPNPSEAAVSDNYHGPFRVLGDPHPGDPSHTSFHSQISCIFKVQGKKDLYIACADRWRPDYNDFSYVEMMGLRALRRLGKQEFVDAELKKRGVSPVKNTSLAEYVWLPLRFEGDVVYIDWKDEWRIEDYD